MRAGLRPRRLDDEAEARGDPRWAGGPHGEAPPLPRPDFRAPPPPWLLPRPPSGAPPPPRPPPDARVPPHLLTWDTIVSWPPPGEAEAPETLWHRDRDDRVPNEGEACDSASDVVFATSRRDGDDEEDEEEERFELNEAWLERFARTEIERRARAKERRKEARREERVVVPAAAAAAARVEKELAERREREKGSAARAERDVKRTQLTQIDDADTLI
jgi:hypothetical protein